MKAIIPVAGVGSTLRPHTHTQPKALVPVAGKAILSYIMDDLIAAGIRDFILVIGYLGDKIETYISETYPDIHVTYVIQEPREGLGQAIWLTREHIQNDSEVLIVLGDTIVTLDLQTLLASPISMLGVKKVDTPWSFGITELDNQGTIKKLVEKPKIPKSNFALVGIYKITDIPALLAALQYIIDNQLKTQNEYHLTDALMKMVEDGVKITTIQVNNWYDCGRKETLLEANSILMNRAEFKRKDYPEFTESIIIQPVSIGKNCNIVSSIIGPNVAIGENTVIRSSVIQNSIIGSFSALENTLLHHSIIGNDSSLKGLTQSLNIGDNTEINFSDTSK
ncbi:sugar phosphate nucleotidyltransferase [Xanthocytophaga agilis]|uniref:Sugar phosphate nucleotidyltransferase n=1 Tax=Xanthocytophaga agilis TaxID=3048010 RepID=A0AAE3R6R0_9BACT|nr:sugar phosphate nucleotidyltransferase [Xanthocytophaga agilis]MDJ1502465.1 sugar phosphate nucleotidyltransferase [Xanthocytophaga agilis]